jgi:hypothetical protein
VVVIRGLKTEHHDTLSRQQSKIRNILGDVYSYLLADRDFKLVVERQAVKPRHPCVWDKSRTVVRSGQRIPAVIEINEPLPDRHVCLDCGIWQDDLDGHCISCGGARLQIESRRIWGWVGIQRYLHANDYGIDFIRNGRKILLRDVSMFKWHDPEDPSGAVALGTSKQSARYGGAVQMARASSVKLASSRWPGSVSKPSS